MKLPTKDAFNLQLAIDEAKRRAAHASNTQRIYRAYNAYCIKPDTLQFDGVTVGFCTATSWTPVD